MNPTTRANRGPAVLPVVLAAGLATLAAWSFRPVFDDTAGFPLLLAILVPVGVALGWGCLATVFGRWMLGGTATVLAVLLIIAVVAGTTRAGLDARLGPSRLLTGVLPATPSGPELATVSALAGFTALIAVRLVVSSASCWWPVVPAMGCLVLGLGVGAATGSLPAWYPLAFVATALTLVLAGRVAEGALGRGRLAGAGAMVLVASAAGLTLTPLVAGDRAPVSLQSLAGAPVVPKQEINPMARYLALRDNLLALEITGTGSVRVPRIGMVTLTEFDGRTWTIRADYRRAGTQLPGTGAIPAPTRDISLDVQVRTPDSIGWLPRAGRPTQISVPELGFDAATGDVVVPTDRTAPAAYRITGREPDIGPDDLRADDPVTETGSTPRLTPELLSFIDKATAGRSSGLGKFLGLYQAFTESAFSYDTSPQARGGHGLRQIEDLLKTGRGTSEQFASAFAVLSRHLGWDARVVLGFRPTWDGDRFRISGPDVYAWVEVRFQRLGWVPVDPNPTKTVGDQGQPGSQPKPPDVLDQVTPPDQSVPQEPADDLPAGDAATPEPDSPVRLTTVVVIGAGILALYVVTAPVARTVRRARARRTGSARRRTIAAWQDTLAALRGAKVPVTERLTTGQVCDLAPGPVAALVRSLADTVDRATYAVEEASDDVQRFAWHCSDSIRAELRRRTTLRRRALTMLGPGALPAKGTREYRDFARRTRPPGPVS